MFELDPKLAADTLPVTELPLSRIVLMNDARFPWLILVPRIVGVREMHLLAPSEIMQLTTEVTTTARVLETLTKAHKMNIAALGNMVPQLHVHVIARFEQDVAWPSPVWGVGQAEPYHASASDDLAGRVKADLDTAFNNTIET